MTREITVTLLLAALQVLILRIAQYALPALYFATSSLFDRRSEVRAGAILFRLAIPFGAGMLVPLLLAHHENLVASCAGVIAWFLVLWPIAWAPSVMLPQARGAPITGLLLLFWVAFAVLPIGGVSVTHLIQGAHTHWTNAFLEAVVTSIPISVAITLVAKAAGARVTFADDVEAEEEDYEEAVDEEYSLSWLDRVESAGQRVPDGLISLATLFVLVLILMRGLRSGRP
jgi:hypothetical protein